MLDYLFSTFAEQEYDLLSAPLPESNGRPFLTNIIFSKLKWTLSYSKYHLEHMAITHHRILSY